MLEPLPNVSKMPVDIRAEVLARLLAEAHGLSVEQLLYEPTGYHQRRGRKDVIGLAEDFSHRLEQALVRIETTREGMYDMLPESIFLRPEEEFGDDVRKTRALSEQEAKARQFLQPFEQVFFWLRVENEQRETDMAQGLEAWWGRFFPFAQTETLAPAQKEILAQMMPYLQDIVGNWDLTAQWLSLLTGHPVHIEQSAPPLYGLPSLLEKRLGDGLLGQDFVLGDVFNDGIPSIQIVLESLAPKDIIDYLPFAPKRDVLEEDLLPHLLPVEIPYAILLKGKQGEGFFELTPDNEKNVLGYTLEI